ncbi:uncharacterized protein LOC141614010 [Silene latifolia]|uniref:uncharacterized protein LOC141614010 n=1 Tax=Silene latifolia TaxID=37657 RepID=UPI003D773252
MARDCGGLGGLWEGLKIGSVMNGGFERVREWVWKVMQELDRRERVVFMVGCWAVWERRNKWVFEEEFRGVGEVVRLYKEVEEGERAEEVEQMVKGGRGDRRQGWTKPSQGGVKINVDAFVKEGIGVGLGTVCRDAEGTVRWMVVEQQRRGVREPREEEAEAMLMGLKEAAKRGYRDVTMESDCQVLIKALKDRVDGRSNFHLILEDIFYVCNSFSNILWSFVGRESNSVAHELARLAPWRIGRREWSNDFPLNIALAVSNDLIVRS